MAITALVTGAKKRPLWVFSERLQSEIDRRVAVERERDAYRDALLRTVDVAEQGTIVQKKMAATATAERVTHAAMESERVRKIVEVAVAEVLGKEAP